MSELEKMREFVESGQSETLSNFWDWLHSQGFYLMRLEQRSADTPCGNPLCKEGKIKHKNPDPLIGWTTEDLPEYVEVECTRCDGKGYVTKYYPDKEVAWLGGAEKLFAMYAGIDLDKLEQERRMVLDNIRKLNEKVK